VIVAFASLFLGLVLGVQPVEVAVGQGVASVELVLDGQTVGRVSGEPWTLPCDFGGDLAPHRLDAIGRDKGGREIGRAVQWINLPRPQAEGHAVFEGGHDGRGVIARLTWESVSGDEPRRVTASFDGRPLAVSDPRHIELPPHDPDRLHFLHAELEFPSHLSAVVEVPFGGTYAQQTATELTATAVALQGGRELPPPSDLAGWFEAGGARLPVVAAEKGPAEVVVVMDREAQEVLWALALRWYPSRAGASAPSETGSQEKGLDAGWRRFGGGSVASEMLRYAMQLGDEQSLRFLWPFSLHRESDRTSYDLFARSEEHPPRDGGVFWLLASAHQPPFPVAEQRLADAVAVAGMTAAARDRRRAVVLFLGEQPRDVSQFAAPAVRRYLSSLEVPLHVWSVAKQVSPVVEARWGEVRSVYSRRHFERAVRDLSQSLDAQRIVWLEGLHLPQEIRVGAAARGLEIVR
jgi:hypothetical protein